MVLILVLLHWITEWKGLTEKTDCGCHGEGEGGREGLGWADAHSYP